jgi:hypothetical protein
LLAERARLLLAERTGLLLTKRIRGLNWLLLLHRRQRASALRAGRRGVGHNRHHERCAALAAGNWLTHDSYSPEENKG